MVQETERTAQAAAPEQSGRSEKKTQSTGDLSADFYLRLLGQQPSCKTTGVCDGCGKCR